jgi:hypothetical protein
LETQQKTVSSSSPWKPNRKLFPDHLSSILHGTLVGSDTQRERKDEMAMARIRPVNCCKLRVRCTQEGNRATCSPTTGRWSAFDMKTDMCFLSSSLSLSPPIFSSCACRWPSTVFLLCYVNCDMPSFFSAMVEGGGVCVCAGSARPRVGDVLVPFVFLWGEILSTDL